MKRLTSAPNFRGSADPLTRPSGAAGANRCQTIGTAMLCSYSSETNAVFNSFRVVIAIGFRQFCLVCAEKHPKW